MKKMLICGATGFIGRNLAEHFARSGEFEVHATHQSRPPFAAPDIQWHQADLRNEAEVARVVGGMEVVLQAAATTSGAKDNATSPWYHVTDNAVMNSLIFRAAHLHGVKRLVFFSCTTMYASQETPVRETDFDANAEMYRNYFGVGWTKVYLEKMAEFYSRLGHTAYTVIRHSNIYGPHDKYDLEKSHVFGATVAKVMNATDRVVVWGAGEERRDLLHVDDLVAFVAAALARQVQPFALYNCGLGEAVSIKDLVRKIVAQSGRALRIEHDLTKTSLNTALCVDCSKAAAEIGWTPKVTLDEGIRRTLEWYRHARTA